MITQKAFLAGMLVMMTAGSFEMAWTTDENRMFLCTMAGGTIGAGVNYCIYEVRTLRQMARQAMANLGLAVIFGPIATTAVVKCSGWNLTIYLAVAISGTIGIGGTAIWRVAAPAVLNLIPDAVQALFRVPKKQPDDDKTEE